MPVLFYNRKLILLEQNNLTDAKKEFITTVSEASKENFAVVRYEVSVYSYYSLGSIGLKQNDYPEALKWFRLAKAQQDQAGGVWMPTITKNIKQLEDAITAQQNHLKLGSVWFPSLATRHRKSFSLVQ